MKMHFLLTAAAVLLASTAGAGELRAVSCANTPCANPWDCWTVSVTYRVNVAPPDQDLPPVYVTRFVEFLHEPGNVWASEQDALCNARKVIAEGIFFPINLEGNEIRVIAPQQIEGIRVWKIPMPD